jgi:SAM-dependent methyltransferase
MSLNDTLKQTFDAEAELYNEMRPTYPEEVFDTLVTSTGIDGDARLLEVGPGTGQATKSLAARGFSIVAVELGKELAAVARRELAQYKNVEVITGAFEDVELAPLSFDVVYSATAFHWIPEEVRFARSHQLLKDGGHLAVIHRNHLAGDAFYNAADPIYKKYGEDRPNDTPTKLITKVEDVHADGIIGDKYFETVHHQVFPDAKEYTADEFVRLISTYSATLYMPAEKREGLLGEIHELINKQFGGTIVRNYGISLTVGRKK